MVKRKPTRLLTRSPARKEPYDKVLIVCEGEKTEPNYLRGLIECYKLNTAHVRVYGESGSAPSSILKFAQEEFEKITETEPFDRVFCVFDKDSQPCFQDTINSIDLLDNYQSITSIPCFEVWVLLHFKYSSAPYVAIGNKSVCEVVITKLNAVLRENRRPDYQKNDSDLFNRLLPQLPTALRNAKNLEEDMSKTGGLNPSTQIHVLVEYLQNLKEQKTND